MHSKRSTIITASDLIQVREPIRWQVTPGTRAGVHTVKAQLAASFRGVTAQHAQIPRFLMPHQHEAYVRTCGILDTFGGACLCDAVGLGKTFVSLAIASRFRSVTVVVPVTIATQWRHAADRLEIPISIVTHERLSRTEQAIAACDLIIVDEAHRFRNPKTRRYRRLSRSVRNARVLLVTATPVVNSPRDLVNLLRLFLSDHALAPFGIRSLERALAGRVSGDTLKAATPLLVARSTSSAGASSSIPKAIDAPVIACAPIADEMLRDTLRRIEDLEFPSFASPDAARLLRSHLYYRLHSSVPALVGTLERHHAYLRRAISAAASGNLLTRRDARLIFDPDDQQLDLALVYEGIRPTMVDASRLRAEQERIGTLLASLTRSPHINPKLNHLTAYLEQRRTEKTIVFVTAVPTARELAAGLSWKRIAVVTGGRGHIASGPLSLEETLALFSPGHNGSPHGSPATDVRVLITTDVLSEGVNLQTADAVVHYDLPWTPLRLQQRLGRISRLGSPFKNVAVRWFVPAPRLEQKLGLQSRLERKLQHQMASGVPVSSGTGRAHVANRALEQRERIITSCRETHTAPDHCYAVVRGPCVAAYSVRWLLDSGCVPDIVVVRCAGEPVADLAEICGVLSQLFSAPVSAAPFPEQLHENARRAIRHRLANGLAGPGHVQVRLIARSIVRAARRLRGGQHPTLLHGLDQTLTQLQQGTRVGGELELVDLLEKESGEETLRNWLADWGAASVSIRGVVVDAVLFGDGTK